MCGFAQQRACKFTCQSEVCTPKGGSTRKACGCFSKKQPNPPPFTYKKAPIYHQASDIAELWLEVLPICKLIAYIGCAVEPRKYC